MDQGVRLTEDSLHLKVTVIYMYVEGDGSEMSHFFMEAQVIRKRENRNRIQKCRGRCYKIRWFWHGSLDLEAWYRNQFAANVYIMQLLTDSRVLNTKMFTWRGFSSAFRGQGNRQRCLGKDSPCTWRWRLRQ